MQIIVDLHNWGKLRLDMITVFQNLKGYYLEKIQDDILAEISSFLRNFSILRIL